MPLNTSQASFARPQTLQTLRRPPRQQLLQLYAPEHLAGLQGNNSYRCIPGLKPSKLSAGLQGNNSYSYMPLNTSVSCLPQPSTCSCRLPGLKPSKLSAGLQGNNSYSYMPLNTSVSYMPQPSTCSCPPSNPSNASKLPQASKATTLTATWPPRQQLLQLHAAAICFSGGSRLPFARPHPTPQTLPTFPQASKATTLTATCPCHLFFRGFKTAVCPPSNPLKPPKRFRRPPRQQLLQLHAPEHLAGLVCPASNPPKRQQLLQLHAAAICFSGGSRLPFARPHQTPQTLPTLLQASKATTLTATCPCHLFFRGFKTAVCPPSNPLKPSKRFRRPPRQQLLQLHAPEHLAGLVCPASNPPKRQQLLQLHAAAICFSGGSRLPFARPHQTPQTLPTLPQASKATTLTATCPCHLFFRGFKTAVCPPSNPLKPPKRFRRPPRQQLLQLHAPEHLAGLVCPASNPPKRQQLLQLHAAAICFSGGSRLPFARPHQTPQTLPTLPQASKATTLTATCPCHLFFRGFKTAVCPPSNPLKPPKRFRRPPRQQLLQLHAPEHLCQLHAPAIYMLLPFARPQTLQTLRRPPRQQLLQLHAPEHLCQLHAPAIYMLLPALKPPKRFQPSRRPPRQQLLQLHAPAICFSGGSRLPFARPQTPQTLPTLPQASKATTLTAIHAPAICFSGGSRLPFARRQTPQTLPNASAGLQGNNSYSYMPLPSVFQEVQDCRLPALKPPKRFQPSRRPPRQQLLQLYMPLPSVFQGVQDCRLPGVKPPKRFQTLPQASKATTLTATCPCHLFFRRFKTAVCPPSNPPNASNLPAGLQGNNSYSYMPLPSVFQGVQDCRLPALKPPKTPQTLPQASKATTLTATCPGHLFFRGFKTAVCPQTPRFRRPPRQHLSAACPSHLHAPAVCPASNPPNSPQASKATTLTATCP